MRRTDQRGTGRGPYRIGARRPQGVPDDPLRDPEVAAFAAAYLKITNLEQRACIEWLVTELARGQGMGKKAERDR